MKKKIIDSQQAERIACARKTSIGGQALIEGIMMRGPKMSAMAVRKPDGEIVLEKWETQNKKPAKIFKLPIIRGVYGFITSMKAGYKALMRSAELSGLEEIEAEMAREKAAKKEAKRKKKLGIPENDTELTENSAITENADQVTEAVAVSDTDNGNTEAADTLKVTETNVAEETKKDESSSALMTLIMVIASVLGVVLAVGLFIMLPTFIYNWLPIPEIENRALASLIKSAFEGILKIALVVAYMALVSLMKDIRRTFQYHGAEHKTIFCYESGMELTVENVRNQRRFHPRCGTAFLILMLIVGMFISFFIDPIFYLTVGALPHVAIRAIIKLLLLPITMGVGYELIKFAGRHDNVITRIISAPGMWLQHMTVFEPDDDMIECAIIAFKEVIPNDNSDNY